MRPRGDAPARPLRKARALLPAPQRVDAESEPPCELILRRAKTRPGRLYVDTLGHVNAILVLVSLAQSAAPFAERASAFDIAGLPVQAEMLVYTTAERDALRRAGGRFAREVEREAAWVHDKR